MFCTCCEENEVWSKAEANGHQLCEACSHTTDCDHSSHRAWSCEDAASHPIWEQAFCEKCAAKERAESEKDDLEQQVRALAAELEWEVDAAHRADTGSVYLGLHRECDACVLGLDRECTCETLKVRISDHGSCYCSEDLSLVIPSGSEGGDDHTIETLRKRLVRRPPAEN